MILVGYTTLILLRLLHTLTLRLIVFSLEYGRSSTSFFFSVGRDNAPFLSVAKAQEIVAATWLYYDIFYVVVLLC